MLLPVVIRRLLANAADHIERTYRPAIVTTLLMVSVIAAAFDYSAISGAFARAQGYYEARHVAAQALEALFREESSLRGYTSTRDPQYLASFAESHRAYERAFSTMREELWDVGLRGAGSYTDDISRVYDQWRTSVAQPLIALPTGDAAQSKQRTGELLFSTLEEDMTALGSALDADIAASSEETRARIISAIVEIALLTIVFGLTVLRMRQTSRTVERRYLAEITEANRSLLSAQRLAGIGNWTKDLTTGEVVWSDELYRIFGLPPGPASEALMRKFDHPEDAHAIADTIAQFERTGQPYRIDHRIVLNDGSVRHVQEQAEFTDDHGTRNRIIGTLLDVTDRKGAEARLAYLAHHDALTGLPNRTLLVERLSHSMEYAARHGRSVAVMFVDIDRFKIINDTLGHSVGDALLAAIGQRLHGVLRSSDTVARSGGDEFIIVLDGIKSAVGVLHTVTINTKGATGNTLTLYDSLTHGTGNVIATIDTTAQIQTLVFDVAFLVGLSASLATGTAADVTISWY